MSVSASSAMNNSSGLVGAFLESGWLLLLGDSITRHVFTELFASLCKNKISYDKRTYHNARTFCVRSKGSCDSFTAAQRTSNGDSANTSHSDAFHDRCPRQVLRPPTVASSSKRPMLCATFDWAPLWDQVAARLDMLKTECGDAPSALITNPGLHELLEPPSRPVGSSLSVRHRVRRDYGVKRHLAEITASLTRPGALTTLVIQSATAVENDHIPARKAHERRTLTNDHIRRYNSEVDNAVRESTPLAATLGVCLTRSDGFSLTTQAGAMNGTEDGVHWRAPFDRLMLNADLEHLKCRLEWHRSHTAPPHRGGDAHEERHIEEARETSLAAARRRGRRGVSRLRAKRNAGWEAAALEPLEAGETRNKEETQSL